MALPLFDIDSKAFANFAANATASHACTGSDRYLFALAGIDRSGTSFMGVTYNGVAMTQLVTRTDPNTVQLALYGLVAPATGAHNLVLSVSSTSAQIFVYGASYTGVHQTTPLGTAISGAGTSTGPTLSPTLSTDELAVVGVEQQERPDAMVIQNGTQRENDAANWASKFAWAERAGSGATQINWLSTNSHEWATVGVALKPVGAAAGPTLVQLERGIRGIGRGLWTGGGSR